MSTNRPFSSTVNAILARIVDGRTDLVIDLLETGYSESTESSDGVSILQWCAYYGDVSAIRILLSRGFSLSSLGDNFSLNGAAFHGHWRLCQFLIEQGAAVNFADNSTGETPLHAALCRPNRPQYELVVEILLNAGGDVHAVTLPQASTQQFMRDIRTCGETPLHRAAAYGSEKTIELLLAAGARKDALDANGNTPLSWASAHLRSDQILRMLCFGSHSIHPERNFSGDRGTGSTGLDRYLLGKPHAARDHE